MTALLFMRWEWSEGGAVTHFQIMTNLLSMLPSKFLILHSTNCKVIKWLSSNVSVATCLQTHTISHFLTRYLFCGFVTLRCQLYFTILLQFVSISSIFFIIFLYFCDMRENYMMQNATDWVIQVPKGFTESHVWRRFINYTLKTNQQSFSMSWCVK